MGNRKGCPYVYKQMINNERLIKTLQKLISYNTTNPPGLEWDCAKWIEKYMRSLGLDVKTYTYAKRRPNVIATLRGSLPRKQASQGAMCITPHFDIVPIGKGWKYDPFGGKIVKGKLYGRGASDDKGNTASCLEIMHSMVEDGFKPRHDIIMAATVDEETGSDYGIIPLLEKRVLKPQVCVVMDSAEYDAIVAQKGLLHIRIQIFGKKAHGAYNWQGVNAIEQASQIINQLKQIKFKYKKHPLLRGPTINIGTIHGGDKVNMVADFCEFSVDTRYTPDMKFAGIIKLYKKIIESVTKEYKIIIDDHQLPYQLDPKHRAVSLFLKTAKKMKCPAHLKGSEGATVVTFFQHHNIPAFATGWAAEGTAHTTDEYIYVKDMCKGTRLLEEYIKAYDRR